MAGSSTSVSRSQSTSDTYIPDYSETPILQEIATHARAMSDVVYNWGMEQFNRAQGDIDSLMRDALSYASPQRIAVDMGMAEAGVMQAGERGRQSAIRDLESYGIDPSSGRYAALDSANRTMTAAAAAGAGNQQRMADQAAGNAMRNQAIAAGLQNRQFGLGVGNSANAFLNTASQLKYPPLGRTSQSTSESNSQSQNDSGGGGGGGGDKGGGGKGGGDKKQQPQQQPRQGQGQGGQQQRGDQGVRPTQPNRTSPDPDPPVEEPPVEDPQGTNWEGQNEPFYNPADIPTADQPFQSAYDSDGYVSGLSPEITNSPWADWGIGPNGEVPGQTPPENFYPTENPNEYTVFPPVDQAAVDAGMASIPSQTDLPANADPTSGDGFDPTAGYDPYANNTQGEAFTPTEQTDPVTGEPIDQVTDADGTQDIAGSLYGLSDEGGWTDGGGGDLTPASYSSDDLADMWEDPTQQGEYDSTFDTFTDADGNEQVADAGFEYTEEPWTDDYDYTQDYGDPDDWTNGEEDYYGGDEGDYGDYGEEDYYGGDEHDDDYGYGDDEGDYEDYYGDDYEEGDYEYEGEDDYDYADEGDDSYDDYADEHDEDYGYGDDSSGDEYYADDGGDDYAYEDDHDYDYGDGGDDGGDYARGGPVRRKPKRQRPTTGYQPQMLQRGRPPPPPQPSRPARGAPMMAPGGPRPGRLPRGPRMPGNFISANGMPPPTGVPQQRMAQGGQAGRMAEPTQGGFVSHELSPSNGSKVDDVNARLNAGEFVIPKDIAAWKGKEFFYKLIAQARKQRSGGDANSQNPQPPQRPQTGYRGTR